MSKKWLASSITFILILPLISFYYLHQAPTITKPRRIYTNIDELRAYSDPSYSLQYEQYLQQQSKSAYRRRLPACMHFSPVTCTETGSDPCLFPVQCNPSLCPLDRCVGGTSTPTTSPTPPTPPPVLPPTPDRDDLPGIDDDVSPYIFVDFSDHHISWDSANYTCSHEIGFGSTLASINRDDTRNTEQEQIDIMTALANNTSTGESCWIGLRFDNTSTPNVFAWQNGLDLNPATDTTNWNGGATPDPTQLPGTKYCVVLSYDSGYEWEVTHCVSGAMDFIVHCALCSNPLYLPYDTDAPTPAPTDMPSKSPTTIPTTPTETPISR